MTFVNVETLLRGFQPSLPLHTPRFRIKEDYLTSVANELICEQTKTGSSWSSHGTIDHPSFTRLREYLSREGRIYLEAGWVNGDRVLKEFYLNDALFKPGEKFLCASAIKSDLARRDKHPLPPKPKAHYDAELHNYKILPAYAGGLVATGEIYNDSKGRFADGELIRTSLVKDVEDGIIITRNTRYKLV
jgi:hypothetical protein